MKAQRAKSLLKNMAITLINKYLIAKTNILMMSKLILQNRIYIEMGRTYNVGNTLFYEDGQLSPMKISYKMLGYTTLFVFILTIICCLSARCLPA